MSPENDNNLQPSNLESATPESGADASSSQAERTSGADAQVTSGAAGVAVAVAREKEAVETLPDSQLSDEKAAAEDTEAVTVVGVSSGSGEGAEASVRRRRPLTVSPRRLSPRKRWTS